MEEENYAHRRLVRTKYVKNKEKKLAKGIYGRHFPQQFEDDNNPGWVYVTDDLNDFTWYVGATRNLSRRMREHKYPKIKGLIKCETVTKAFQIEYEFHNDDEPWNWVLLQFIVHSYGGEWNEKGIEWQKSLMQ